MNTNKDNSFVKKILPNLLAILFFTIILIICLLKPGKTTTIICSIIIILCIVARIVLYIIRNENRIKISIKDKKSALTEVYKTFELENKKTIVTINTKDEKVLEAASKIFPGSKQHIYKNSFNMLLKDATLKGLKELLKKNEPDKILIHRFNIDTENKDMNAVCGLAIYVDKNLLIQYKKGLITKEQKRELIDKLKKSK